MNNNHENSYCRAYLFSSDIPSIENKTNKENFDDGTLAISSDKSLCCFYTDSGDFVILCGIRLQKEDYSYTAHNFKGACNFWKKDEELKNIKEIDTFLKSSATSFSVFCLETYSY